MKFLVFLLLVILAGGAAYIGAITPPEKYEKAYDLVEPVLFQWGELPGLRNLDKKLKARLGYCESAGPQGEALPENSGKRIPFTVPFELGKGSAICLNPASPKTFMLVGEGVLSLRRDAGVPPVLSVNSGKIQVASEELNMVLRLPGFDVALSSKMPSRFGVIEEEARTTLLVVLGKVDFSFRMREGTQQPKPLQISISAEGQVIMNGAPLPMRNNRAVLLPTGKFEELPPETVPIGMSTDTAASTSTATSISIATATGTSTSTSSATGTATAASTSTASGASASTASSTAPAKRP